MYLPKRDTSICGDCAVLEIGELDDLRAEVDEWRKIAADEVIGQVRADAALMDRIAELESALEKSDKGAVK